jgi:hypothetical protein
MGFVVRVSSKLSNPRWLGADEDGTPDFGPRDQATVFPTREAADREAKRWSALLEPALTVAVESADD